MIVAGDLNDHRGQPSMRRIRGRDDIDEDLYQTGSPVFFAGDRRRALADRWTQTSQGVRSQVDHILLSPSIVDACGLEAVEPIFPRQSDALVSDHRPVLVRLAFPEQAAAAAASGDHPALAATAWVQTSVEYRMVAEAAYDRAAECLDRLVTDSDALADPDHRPRTVVASLADRRGHALDGGGDLFSLHDDLTGHFAFAEAKMWTSCSWT